MRTQHVDRNRVFCIQIRAVVAQRYNGWFLIGRSAVRIPVVACPYLFIFKEDQQLKTNLDNNINIREPNTDPYK